MGKFKINLELQGFKLNVEGEREDLPAIRRELQDRLTLLTPSATLLNGGEPAEKSVAAVEVPPKKSKRRATGSAPTATAVTAVEFKHDVERFGHPAQTWSTPKKAIWLLYITAEQGGPAQMSAPAISATFNKYFREAGLIQTSHINRDLAAAKLKSPAQVSSDVSKTPMEWFLTTEGKKIAEQLVAEVAVPKQ